MIVGGLFSGDDEAEAAEVAFVVFMTELNRGFVFVGSAWRGVCPGV